MKPLVILDTNALHGRKPFTRAQSAVLLNLARTGHIRLVVPEVVLHELSRKWAENLDVTKRTLAKALDELNSVLAEIDADLVEISPEPPALTRSDFYSHAAAFLGTKNVEIALCPDVDVQSLLTKDLDMRKPFTREGKGFRDALIWETACALCAELDSTTIPVLFVTNNGKDFCDEQSTDLHPDLQDELPGGQRFEVVRLLKDLLNHKEIEPLTALLRVADALTTRQVVKLVGRALAELSGRDLDQTFEVYDRDGIYSSPISTALEDVAINWIDPDDATIRSEIFRTGDDEMTIRATVEGQCELEGFISKGDFFADESRYTYFEDWNRHLMRVIEPRRLRFSLSADFTESTLDDLALTADEVEDTQV